MQHGDYRIVGTMVHAYCFPAVREYLGLSL